VNPYWVQAIGYAAPPTHAVIVLVVVSQDSVHGAPTEHPGDTHAALPAPSVAHEPPACEQS
jgi:hypothetical protein